MSWTRSVGLVAVVLSVAACTAEGNGNGGVSSTGSATSGTTTTSATPDTTAVQVFFVDQDAFNEGVPPYVSPVERAVDPADPPRGALDALFAGPTAEESAAGLRLVASEATGVGDLRIDGGTAHVTLAGGCSSGGSTLSIADQIVATLLQFAEVRSVKIYDPQGRTESPDEPGDSIPECLEP